MSRSRPRRITFRSELRVDLGSLARADLERLAEVVDRTLLASGGTFDADARVEHQDGTVLLVRHAKVERWSAPVPRKGKRRPSPVYVLVFAEHMKAMVFDESDLKSIDVGPPGTLGTKTKK